MRLMRRVVSGSAVIALVLGAGAWGGQALPQVAPAPVTSSIAGPLPTTQALFDGYVRDKKMPVRILADFQASSTPVLDSYGLTPQSNDCGARRLGETQSSQHQRNSRPALQFLSPIW